MSVKSATNSIFTDWKPQHAELWGQETLHLGHRLDSHPLLQEEALAELIDRVPRAHYDICTMGKVDGEREWREGDKGELTGAQVIEAIRSGRIWINMRRLHLVDKPYADLLSEIFAEIEGRVPNFDSFKHNLGVLISSPNAQVYYHCDVPGQSLWQIKGHKKVYIYPTRTPFLKQEMMEGIIIGETEEEGMRYEEWFDDYAKVVDLQPGRMLHWPLNGPHKVVNGDCLNISITTEHWTKDIRNSYGVHYANGILRRKLGMKNANLSHDTRGLMVYPKLALAALWKYSGLEKRAADRRMVTFRVDPQAPGGFNLIDAYEREAA